MFRLCLFLSLILFSPISLAVTPMEYYHNLVAGGESAEFQDGSFIRARFNYPTGLAFDATGRKLFVADSGNRRIRVVDLDAQNAVTTLAGSGADGSADGAFATASFHYPDKLSALPDGRLALVDVGNNSIRILDLKNQMVSTIAQGLNILDMVYNPKDDCLYFSEQENRLEKLDLKTKSVSTVFSNNSELPSPGALCIYRDHLCIADRTLPIIYEFLAIPTGGTTPVPTPTPEKYSPSAFATFVAGAKLTPVATPASNPLKLQAVGSAKDVLALAPSGGVLYALEKGGSLVKVGLPDSSLVKFPTPWGFLFKSADDYNGNMPIYYLSSDFTLGFAASPTEERKFYISTRFSIVSVKDYDFEKRWAANEGNMADLTDFNYPAKKPPNTFRILVTGDSRNSQAFPIPTDPATPVVEENWAPKVAIFSKQLELLLNTDAALQNSNTHFEVLNFTHRGDSLCSHACYEYPELVKKYDVDLVVSLAAMTGYSDYYVYPMTKDNIPSNRLDPEYMLKPLAERAVVPAAKDLVDRCISQNIPIDPNKRFPGDGLFSLYCTKDAQVLKDLRELSGHRLEIFQNQLNSMKTSEGTVPQWVLYYLPHISYPNECLLPFWSDVCAQYHLKFMDLTDPYYTLKNSYYPATRGHLSEYGNVLVARILEHMLVEDKFVTY